MMCGKPRERDGEKIAQRLAIERNEFQGERNKKRKVQMYFVFRSLCFFCSMFMIECGNLNYTK